METTTKKCKACGRELPVSELDKHWRSKDGYRTICKSCGGVHEKRKPYAEAGTIIKRTVEGGVLSLKGINAKDLIEELRYRGYKGKLVYTREVVV